MNNTRDRFLITTVVIALLYVGKAVFIPLSYSLLLAMVLYPMVSRLERRGLNRALSITAALSVVIVLFSGIVVLLMWQLHAFMVQLPALREGSSGMVTDLVELVQKTIHGTPQNSAARWEALLAVLPKGMGGFFLKAMDSLFGMVFNLFLIPILTALLLYDRRRYVVALSEFAGATLRPLWPDILHRSIHNFSAFIVGTAKVYLIVGVLNSLGLALLGVDHAIFFGMLSALMTIIPYVGIVISSLLPMSVAWIATGNVWSPLGVVAVYAVVQYLEANLIFPKVVGRQLHVNTLASIVIVLAGALLWGVSGMILLLPFMAILKIISSDVPSMRGIDLLLGDEDPSAPVSSSPKHPDH
jgi:predicted PurR-regulated permease PerM